MKDMNGKVHLIVNSHRVAENDFDSLDGISRGEWMYTVGDFPVSTDRLSVVVGWMYRRIIDLESRLKSMESVKDV